MDRVEAFVLRAKAACYVGDGARAEPSRRGAHDRTHAEGDLTYRDSYFGGTDFVGQEVVWAGGRPVWAMNYRGAILRDDLIDAARAGAVIKAALSAMYRSGRFLGGFDWTDGDCHYVDASQGGWAGFTGSERIDRQGIEVYRLHYHGGRIRD